MGKELNEIKSEKIEVEAKLNSINKKIDETEKELKSFENKVCINVHI